MNDKEVIKLKPLKKLNMTIGELPASYLQSMTYEEQLIFLSKKMQEIIDFANNELSEKLEIYIDERFNEIMINSMYDSENETLILYLDGSDE